MGVCQGFLRTKPLPRDGGKDRPLSSELHVYIYVFFISGFVICRLRSDWVEVALTSS